jgi:predicted aspartyl protease
MVGRMTIHWLRLAVLTGLVQSGVNGAVPADATASSQPATNVVTLPFEFVSGRILVSARVNDAQPALMMLDTGYSINMLSRELAESLGLKRTGHITIVGVAGEEQADQFEGVAFDLAGATYRPRRVAALPASYQRHWRKRDGVLGAGFFKRFVVEIDPKGMKISLREPDAFHYSGNGEVIPFRIRQSTPIVEAAILLPDQAPITGRFEIDTGCDGGLCIGSDFVNAHHLVESTGQTEESGRRGLGGDAKTRIGRVPKFRLGSQVVEKPLSNFFLEGSPVDDGLAGHIGMQVLRRFKVIFDYSRERMILESLE